MIRLRIIFLLFIYILISPELVFSRNMRKYLSPASPASLSSPASSVSPASPVTPSFSLLLLLLLVGPLISPATAQNYNPFGPLNEVGSDMILPQSVGQAGFNEFWNYHFYLDQDIRVHITFSAVDFGAFKSPVNGIRMSIQNFDGKTWQVSREYPIERLTVDKSKFLMRLHPERDMFFQGELPYNHKVFVAFTKDEITYSVDLDFTDIQPAIKWGDGHYGIRDGGLSIITHIPYARVRGHIGINDKKVNVTGTAYMDHSWQFESSVKMIHSAYKFVSHENADNWQVMYFILPQAKDEFQTVGHRIVRHDGSIRHNGINMITSHKNFRIDGNRVFQDLEISLGSDHNLKLSRKIDREVHTTFGELNGLSRRLVRTYLGGEIIDFRGVGTLSDNGTTVIGEYNFLVID